MALFPPGKGGGQHVDYGYKGKGVTTHLLTEGNRMPLSVVVTGASGDERKQVIPLLEQVKIRRKGRSKSCPKELHADKGYDAKALRISLCA